MSTFDNKVAVVTGAAMGIGEATAEAFAAEGAVVVLLDLNDTAGEVASRIGGASFFVKCDVANASAVEGAFEEIARRVGGVDILVNNAGIQRYGTVTETTEEDWDLVMGVNLKSAFLCARQAIPQMRVRGGGVVVNISSVQAFLSQQNVAAYTTSKTALLGLTRSLAVDFAPDIRCVAVCPGTVDTPMLREAIKLSPDPQEVLEECTAMHPLQRIGSPEEVAGLILYLASPAAGFITGQTFRIDGGLGLSIAGSKRS